MQVAPSCGQFFNSCKWRHLVAKFGTNASGATISWRDNSSLGAIPWVRCASGNVSFLICSIFLILFVTFTGWCFPLQLCRDVWGWLYWPDQTSRRNNRRITTIVKGLKTDHVGKYVWSLPCSDAWAVANITGGEICGSGCGGKKQEKFIAYICAYFENFELLRLETRRQ